MHGRADVCVYLVQLVKGSSPEVAQLRRDVSARLRQLMEFTAPPATSVEQIPACVEAQLRTFLASTTMQDERVARFRAHMVKDFIGDPAHVLGAAPSPPCPAVKWSHVRTSGCAYWSVLTLT